MQSSVKSQVFNYLSNVQKSDLCHFVVSFVKKDYKKSADELAEKFIEDQRYYIEIDSTRFPYLSEFIDEPEFEKDLKLYIKECQLKCKVKEAQKPLYEKQKAYMKEQRKIIKEKIMAKDPPTKKQVSYYKSLCKKYNLEVILDKDTNSKLDYRNAIDEILQKHAEEKTDVLQKLNSVNVSS
jgi:hypothetical protein